MTKIKKYWQYQTPRRIHSDQSKRFANARWHSHSGKWLAASNTIIWPVGPTPRHYSNVRKTYVHTKTGKWFFCGSIHKCPELRTTQRRAGSDGHAALLRWARSGRGRRGAWAAAGRPAPEAGRVAAADGWSRSRAGRGTSRGLRSRRGAEGARAEGASRARELFRGLAAGAWPGPYKWLSS